MTPPCLFYNFDSEWCKILEQISSVQLTYCLDEGEGGVVQEKERATWAHIMIRENGRHGYVIWSVEDGESFIYEREEMSWKRLSRSF